MKAEEYFPQAFDEEYLQLGQQVAGDPDFYVIFVRYVLSFLLSEAQIVHFRKNIIEGVGRVVGIQATEIDRTIKITWSALSFCSERYFEDLAQNYEWCDSDLESIRARWIDLLAKVFLPTKERRLESSDLRILHDELIELRRREEGPFSSCNRCESKCHYHCDSSEIASQPRLAYDFNNVVNQSKSREAVKSASKYCWTLAFESTGKHNVDLAYCLYIHFLMRTGAPTDLRPSLMSAEFQQKLAYDARQHIELLADHDEK